MIRIGEFAKIFNLSLKTIRLYEEKGLIKPTYIDNYTGYRYYDESNIDEMTKILILKELGLSLKEIKNFSLDNLDIKEKIKKYEDEIYNIKRNIHTLNTLLQKKEEITKMKPFINDEKAIGKWKLLGVSNTHEEAINKKYIKDYFKIDELYLLPNGEEYWVIKWTKGFIYIKDTECPYEIKEKKMYIEIKDPKDNSFYKVATYEKIDNKKYTIEEIRIKDNTNIPFIEDKNLIGFWKSIDFVKEKASFNPQKNYIRQYTEEKLFLDKIIVTNDNDCIATFNRLNNENTSKNIKYTKGYIFNLCCKFTSSQYEIIQKNNKEYLIIEWKSGDYIYGKMINGYYVLEKMKQK